MKPAWADKEYVSPEPWQVNVHPCCASRLLLLRRTVAMDPTPQAITYMKMVKLRASCWTISQWCWIDNFFYKQKHLKYFNRILKSSLNWHSEYFDTWLRKHKLAWDFGHAQSQYFLIFSIVYFFIHFIFQSQPPLSSAPSQNLPYSSSSSPHCLLLREGGAPLRYHPTLGHLVFAAHHTSFLHLIYRLRKPTLMTQHQM